MDEIRQHLAPLTDWIPGEIRDLFPIEVWWLFGVVLALLVLLVLGWILRGVLRLLFRRRPKIKWDPGLQEDLNACPMPGGVPALTVYNIPASIRLVVVAPGGKGVVVEAPVVAALLERVVSGLGTTSQRERPRIRVWPAALSHLGFANTFHRCTPTGEPEGQPSHWVLLAGRAQAGSVPIFIGLGLWTEEPTTLGRINLEDHDWRRVLGRVLEQRQT